MGLHFGLALDFGRPAEGTDRQHERFRSLIELAETHGFESVWAGETYLTEPTTSHLSSPFLVLASLASQTRLKLGTGVILLPAWHPLRLAYDAAVLDHLTAGRFLLGVGVGRPELARRFGLDPSRIADFVDDTLAALRAFWTGERSFRGKYLSLEGAVHPLPLTPAGPPIWVGGAIRRSVERAASLGDGWYAGSNYPWSTVIRQIQSYRAALAALGKSPDAGIVSVNRLAIVTETESDARRAAETYLAPTLASYAARGRPGSDRKADATTADLSETLDHETYLVGTPSRVAATMHHYASAGVTHMQVRVYPNGVPFDVAMRTVELLGSGVLPELVGRIPGR